MRILRSQRVDIADLDIDLLYAGPFGAPAEKPAPAPNDACSVERIARDQKLHTLTRAQIRADYNVLGCSVLVQYQNLDRVTQVIVIELVVADSMQAYRCIGRDHEIECGACRPAINKRCREPTGRDLLVTDETHPHESARGVRLKIQQSTYFLGR